MLIKTPNLEGKEISGFTPDVDIFDRKDLGEAISNLFESTDENLIVGIDGQWGEGKSTFALMLSAHLNKEKNIPTIYFDAFKNDFQKDAFLAVASELQEIFESHSTDSKKEFRTSIIKASKAMARGAIRIVARTATAGILDDTFLDNLGTSDNAEDEISDGIDKILSSKLDDTKTDKASLETFRKTLEKNIEILGNNKPVVFIIDELDRCRPDFCLELIEQVKHLFSVKNLKFLFITNRNQIHASIRKRYGQNINSHLYLQKFMDLWIELPRIETEYNSHSETYFKHLISSVTQENETLGNYLVFETLKSLFITNKTSYRGIQKTVSYLAIFFNTSKITEYTPYYQTAIALACFSKAEQPELINKIHTSTNHLQTLNTFFPPQNITKHRSSYAQEHAEVLLRYLASTEDQQKEMIKNREIDSGFGRMIPTDLFKTINNKLNLFSN
ncbi:P-loop NTPase fold protein [Pseudomonas sp. 25 R 14]|uniref:KAP family P-loop NTPase fold protein n=1 Tax=Pseudomonas sp. 25 R 14 TaxID=1844109 RepID=UPI000812B038|nr:P-loop NTPase fold protein [Pseudomonas sp. 25 R 14]CRM79226.1 putative P-loop ATPase [Pseudomonas sp. 25 R 14]